MAPSLPRTSSRRRPGPSTRHSNGGGDVLRDPARCLRSETLCVDRERSGCRGVHGSRPVPSAALAGTLGAGMTLESGAIVPLAYGAIGFPERHPGAGRDPVHGTACHFIVGMTNSAPSLTPDGQREVTVLVLV